MLGAGQNVMQCTSDTAIFDRLVPLVCSGTLGEQYSPCLDKFTATFFDNRARVPVDRQEFFDKTVEMGTNLIFYSCNMQIVRKFMLYFRQDDVCLPITENMMDCTPPQDVTASIARCMSQANFGEHVELFDEEGATAPGAHRFPLWGDMYTFPDFVAAVADSFSTATSEPFNYFINSGEGTVPQTPQTPPDEAPRDEAPRDEEPYGQYLGAWGD